MKLIKPICFFDLETTGVNISKDRIVEICIVKVCPDGKKEVKNWLVNPTVPIPKEASDIHRITDEKVADSPTFKAIAPDVLAMLKGTDLGGFNSNRFDIPLLVEELLRAECDFDFSKINMVDVQVIYHKMEPRNLSAAYSFYCNKELEDAHSAEADTLATHEIFEAQMNKYEELNGTLKAVSDFSKHKKNADFAGFVGINKKGKEVLNFGKYKDKTVEDILESDPGYFNWIQNAEFPLYTKKVLTSIKSRKFNR